MILYTIIPYIMFGVPPWIIDSIAARGVCRFEVEVEFKFGILKMAAPEGATSAG